MHLPSFLHSRSKAEDCAVSVHCRFHTFWRLLRNIIFKVFFDRQIISYLLIIKICHLLNTASGFL